MEKQAKEAGPEVAKVLVEVPKSPRMMRPKKTPTKEIMKDKKEKPPAILMHTLPRQNPTKPTTQEKGKAIVKEEPVEVRICKLTIGV